MSEHTCLNVIFIPVFCQKINFSGVCAWAEHMVVDLWRWQPIWAIAPYGSSSPLLADALGFSTIKWRSSLFSLSTAVPCTLKCFVNHCLPSTEAAKALIKFEFWDVMLEWWNFIPFLHEWNWLWKGANKKIMTLKYICFAFHCWNKREGGGEKKNFLAVSLRSRVKTGCVIFWPHLIICRAYVAAFYEQSVTVLFTLWTLNHLHKIWWMPLTVVLQV